MYTRFSCVNDKFDSRYVPSQVNTSSSSTILTVRQGIDLDRLASVTVDLGNTSKSITTFNVHGTRTTDAFTARTTESQGRILFILNLDQSIEYHRTTLVQVNLILLQVGLLGRLIRVLYMGGLLVKER